MAADGPIEKILYALIYHTDLQGDAGINGGPRAPLTSRVAPLLAIGVG